MDKHNANIAILRLLEKYTDDDHKVSQQEMVQLLKKEYGLEIDRRSVKSNIEFLQEAGYEISTEKGYRLQSRTLENAELRVLIDSVLFSKALSDQQGKELILELYDSQLTDTHVVDKIGLDYYVEEADLARDLAVLDRLSGQPYYAMMAVAWAISILYIRYPHAVSAYLLESKLDDVTYQKALQKIMESQQVSAAAKARIRALRQRRASQRDEEGTAPLCGSR